MEKTMYAEIAIYLRTKCQIPIPFLTNTSAYNGLDLLNSNAKHKCQTSIKAFTVTIQDMPLILSAHHSIFKRSLSYLRSYINYCILNLK